ncbi:prepilin peptidase [Rhodococcus fascians]|nr:prepilin peptidase [Rhodococcus fascians]MBY4112718.1 prepilin peptidase [Rhodococcus fascians]
MWSLGVAVTVGAVAGVVLRVALRRWQPRLLPALCVLGSGWAWWRFGGSPHAASWGLITWCVLTWWFAALIAVDLGCRRLPNVLTVPGAVVVPAVLMATGSAQALLGGGLLFGIYLVVHLGAPRAFGAGDVKLAWSVGSIACLGGAAGWTVAALSAPVATAVVGSIAAACGYPRARIAHGPSMCAATLLAVAAATA